MPIPPIQPYAMPATLPRNIAQWSIDPRRAMLLIHDMQQYFLDMFPAGQPPVRELVENVALLRERCAQAGIPVAYTAQPGGMTDEQRGLLKDFWGSGMSAEAEQRAIIGAVAPRAGDEVHTKWRYSASHRSGLLDSLREQGRDQLMVCGVYAHVGVLMTLCEAFTSDIQASLVADAAAVCSARHPPWALHSA